MGWERLVRNDMIQAIRIQNLRSLYDTGYIKNKPLTVLVGKNSCGKSTFARTFPLLRQSAEEKTRTSILWFGRYVDFGDFNDAIRSGEDEITFSFKINVRKDTSPFIDESFLFFFEDELLWLEDSEIEFSLTLANGTVSQYAKRLQALIYNVNIEIEADEQRNIVGLKINNREFNIEQTDEQKAFLSEGKLVPWPTFLTRQKRSSTNQKKVLIAHQSGFRQSLFNEINSFVHQKTDKKKVYNSVSRMGLGSNAAIRKFLLQNYSLGKYFIKNMEQISAESEKLENIKTLAFANRLPNIFKFIDNAVSTHFESVKYIEPLRATAERYYRVQDLAVNEIDPRGSNIAMYIKSLHPNELGRFNKWCEEALNFRVSYDQNPGHMAIKIVENNSERNITDMGFGYSQLLPIAMHIWDSCFNFKNQNSHFINNRDESVSIVIEQPELHLHPAFQAKIADIFSSAARANKKTKSSIIIETHSSHLINRLGELVATNEISPEDIQIVLFERENGEDKTTVSTSHFDEDGLLKNWPVGFMQPEI